MRDYEPDAIESPEGRRFTSEAQFVEATNVSNYFYETEKEYWEIPDFPSLAPPWNDAWIELKMPESSYDPDAGERHYTHVQNLYMSVMMHATEFPEDFWHSAFSGPTSPGLYLQIMGAKKNGIDFPYDKKEVKKRQKKLRGKPARWMVVFTLFSSPDPKVVIKLASYIFYLDPQGRAIPDSHEVYPASKQMMEFASYTRKINSLYGPTAFILPFLYTISLLHCKNVDLEQAQINRGIRHRAKKRKVPVIEFKELIVKPLGRKTKEGPVRVGSEEYYKHRRHICRGHFRDCRIGAGLFGKLHGIFWIPQHLRGSSAEGAIIKDYIIQGETT